MENEKRMAFIRLMKDAFWYAEKAYKCIYDRPRLDQKEDRCFALSCAAACTAKYSAAEAIYWTFPEIERSEIPELFTKFDTFVKKFQKSCERNQYQTDSIFAFMKLEESFRGSICNQETES